MKKKNDSEEQGLSEEEWEKSQKEKIEALSKKHGISVEEIESLLNRVHNIYVEEIEYLAEEQGLSVIEWLKAENEKWAKSEKEKFEAHQKYIKENWPPFPLNEDGCYPGSKDPVRISCAIDAMNWVIEVALSNAEYAKTHYVNIWSNEPYKEQYIEALKEAADIYSTWTHWGFDLFNLPKVENTNRPNKKDYFNLRDWFVDAFHLVEAELEKHERPERRKLGKIASLIYEKLCSLPEHKAMQLPEIVIWLYESSNYEINLAESNIYNYLKQLEPWGLQHDKRIGYSINKHKKV